MDVTITGSGAQNNVEGQVDPTHQATRVQLRPAEHVMNGVIGGHYAVTAYSGTIAASLVANSVLFAMRWAADNKLMVLKHLNAFLVITGTPAALTTHALEAVRATAFSVSFSANNTAVSIGAGGKMRTGNMAQSAFSTLGAIQVCTTAGMTGQTYTLDTNGFAMAALQGTLAAGMGGNLQIYDVNDFGEHPLVLGSNEGFVIRNPIALPGTSTVQAGFQAVWAEVAAY